VSAEVNYGIRFQNKEESENFVKQLCDEIEKRLDDVEMIGKTITLKLMVFIIKCVQIILIFFLNSTKNNISVFKIRNSEAPKESAKFLGHGFCDHITKSSSLTKSTSNSKIIFQ